MNTRRFAISVLTACALLAQSWALAGMRPVNLAATQAPASAESAMPCHGAANTELAAPADCCGDASSCAKVCAAATAIATTSTAPAFAPAMESAPATAESKAHPAHRHTPLRPPITSQS